MLLSIDTCSWLRIRHIHAKIGIDFRPILEDFRLVTTAELQKEQKNYGLDAFITLDFISIPLRETERVLWVSKLVLESFDPADQDIAILGHRDGITAVTDDRDLFNQCELLGIPAFQLWSFALALVKEGLLTKNEFARCRKLWVTAGRYDLKTLKLMASALQKLR